MLKSQMGPAVEVQASNLSVQDLGQKNQAFKASRGYKRHHLEKQTKITKAVII